jgi:SpoIIAA-like
MPATIDPGQGNLYRVQISGLLLKSEWEKVQQAASSAIERVGRISLLFILDRFEGFEPNADWGDMNFHMKHGKDIDKIAIVGDDRWRDRALMFAGAGLRTAEVEFFTSTEISRAQAWLSQ